MGEQVPLTGTPFSLHYQSDRVSGRRHNSEITIPITPATGLPPLARDAYLHVEVAGRVFSYEKLCVSSPAVCEPGGSFLFDAWDGIDVRSAAKCRARREP